MHAGSFHWHLISQPCTLGWSKNAARKEIDLRWLPQFVKIFKDKITLKRTDQWFSTSSALQGIIFPLTNTPDPT